MPDQTDEDGQPRWYALAVHARKEKAIKTSLGKRGYEVFLPARIERHSWSDRIQKVEIALFPGYLFVYVSMSAARRVELLEMRGTIDLVGRAPGDTRIAHFIPDQEIANLKAIVALAVNLDPTERLVKGACVLVASGPLKGVRGIVAREPDGKRRLIVQIELLGRGVSAELRGEDLVEA